jgi:hypothetical protein
MVAIMAVLLRIFCRKCKQSKERFAGSGQYPTICSSCEKEEKAEAKAAYFAELDKLTLEERLRKVEEWIYEYRPPVSLSDMRF